MLGHKTDLENTEANFYFQTKKIKNKKKGSQYAQAAKDEVEGQY